MLRKDTKRRQGNGGVLITIDGPSGIGKSTISSILEARLNACGIIWCLRQHRLIHKLGKWLEGGTFQFLGIARSCLVAADHYHHQEQVVAPALFQGVIVICDRDVPSSIVLGHLDGVERNFVRNMSVGMNVTKAPQRRI